MADRRCTKAAVMWVKLCTFIILFMYLFLHYFKLNTPLFLIWSYCIWLYNNDYVFFTFLVWCPWRVVTSVLIPVCSGSTTSWSGLMRAPSRAADFLFTACLTLLCLLLWLLCVYHHSWSHYKSKIDYFFLISLLLHWANWDILNVISSWSFLINLS